MKSNVTLHSPDRELFGVVIKQQTKNEMLSVSDLQKAYDKAKWVHGWNSQSISQVMQSDNFCKKCFGVLLELGLIKVDITTFMEMVEKEGIAKILKGLDVYKTTGRGENKSTYANPYIWMTLALELNYILYGKVIVWITDTLIFDRVEAGSEYRPMNEAIKSIVKAPDYVKYAKQINLSVFGRHETGMRNIASAKELKKISDIEKFVVQGIKLELIKTEQQVLSTILNFK